MRLAYIGNEAAIGFGNIYKRTDFARVVGTHLHYGQFVLLLQAQKREGHTDMVIEIALRIEHLIAFLQHRGDEFLGRGLSVRAGDSDDACTHLSAMLTSQVLQGFQAIVHEDDVFRIGIPRLVHHGISATFLQGLTGKGIAIEGLPFQGDEHRAFGAVASVGGHASALFEAII